MGNISSANSTFPVAAIIALAVAAWAGVIILILAIRYCLLRKGVCEAGIGCQPCGTEDGGTCCECCVACTESCSCKAPSINGCLNTCCPKKKFSCVELLLCQCFGDNCCTAWCNECGNLKSQEGMA